MSNNFNQFMKDLDEDIKELKAKRNSEAKKIILGTYNFIIDGSAVDTGLYITSHILTYNKKSDEIPDETDTTRINKNKKVLNSVEFKTNDTITIQNNLLYSSMLESGSSKQQPAGLYGRAREKARAVINKRFKI